MWRKLLSEAEGFLTRNKRHRSWQRAVTGLACVVVFCTTYALILPALTLEHEGQELTCTLEEHQHGPECYAEAGALLCTIPEREGAHAHGEDCYDENGVLTCQLEASDGHQHGPDCYGAGELTCTLDEHTHTEECYSQAEPDGNPPKETPEEEITEEELADPQVEEVTALIDALPTQEEMGETLTAFEDDEDGYDAYLTEIVARAKAAYKAYSLLTEAQQEQVTNADRLLALEPLWSMQTLETNYPALTDDSAYVTGITVDSISDGTAPFDDDNNAGNDSGTTNKIVRTFDTVTYNFTVTMDSYESGIYSEARVKLEFVLPLTADQATFDQGAMAWMDQTAGYAPVLTTETRTIDGKETQCQVLTCYKQLLPSGDHPSVVPGTFGEMVVVNVKSMKNGDTFAPVFSACMEYGTWEDNCTTHSKLEKATVVADKVTVSAAPKYNIQLGERVAYKDTFDFSTGGDSAANKDKGQVTGQLICLGLTIQLYNDNTSKGIKGIELPDGSPITFDINVSSQYHINDPNPPSGYTQGQSVDITNDYMPLLWSYDGNLATAYGTANGDGRILKDSWGGALNKAPRNAGGGDLGCYNGGSWSATQEGTTIHVTVSGYTMNVDSMPIYNADGSTGSYGVDLGIGCFSAGELWILQPYNKIGSTNTSDSAFDVVNQYGTGTFTTKIEDVNLSAKSLSGQGVTNQMVTNDDLCTPSISLLLPGSIINRVWYTDYNNVNVTWTGNYSNGYTYFHSGQDAALVGTNARLVGGFTYEPKNEPANQLYWGTTLLKFSAEAFTIDTSAQPTFTNTTVADGMDETATMQVLYATKQDGTDWASDYEMQHTYEDSLKFYSSVSEIPSGYKCVGVLFCFQSEQVSTATLKYIGSIPVKIADDQSLAGNTYMLVSTSRAWTKSMFENAGMSRDEIPDWTQHGTSLSSFPPGAYVSGNIDGSYWYQKEEYRADGSGVVGNHNCTWAEWGDTMLLISYKTGITKTLCQTSDNTAKTNYNLDAEQRVVDFKLQPRTYYDQVSGSNNLTTTVTIVDTLPKYLTYVPGSSYFGGTYTQTSTNGGTQGTITGGTLREPDSVVTNADGTQTLTWVITGVTVGEDMPAIYYSANIGDRNNKDKDVPTGTTDLVNKVRITATHDIRQPTLANGNYAEVGIAVTRGAASSYGKYSKQDVVEADGTIDYVIYYDNNAVTEATKPVLVDAMPVDKILGSNFTGTWKITSFKISLVGTDTTLAALQASLHYTMESEYEGKDLAYLQANQVNPNENWEDATIGTDGTVTDLNGKKPVMWVLNCESLPGNSELRVDYTIKLIPEAGSTLDNIKYVNQFSTGNTTTTTETPVVKRTLEGLTWMDDNGNGIQDEATSSRISGVKVELLKLKENGDPTKESDYEPYHYQGDSTLPVVEIETGKQVSVLASSASDATDYGLGRYKFTDLPAGTFAVRFTDGSTTKISPLLASPSNRGTDDMKDSDGIATYTDNHATLEKTVILGIDMPAAENMSVTLYESKYHDSGFYEKGHELPTTGGPGTALYTLGGLTLMAGAILLLLYQKKTRGKEGFPAS